MLAKHVDKLKEGRNRNGMQYRRNWNDNEDGIGMDNKERIGMDNKE